MLMILLLLLLLMVCPARVLGLGGPWGHAALWGSAFANSLLGPVLRSDPAL